MGDKLKKFFQDLVSANSERAKKGKKLWFPLDTEFEVKGFFWCVRSGIRFFRRFDGQKSRGQQAELIERDSRGSGAVIKWYQTISVKLANYAPIDFWLNLTPNEILEWCDTIKQNAKK